MQKKSSLLLQRKCLGDSVPKEQTFVRITNQQVYCELTAFRKENDEQHEAIKELLASQKAQNDKEHENIRGSINVLKATIGGIISVGTGAILWLLNLR